MSNYCVIILSVIKYILICLHIFVLKYGDVGHSLDYCPLRSFFFFLAVYQITQCHVTEGWDLYSRISNSLLFNNGLKEAGSKN